MFIKTFVSIMALVSLVHAQDYVRYRLPAGRRLTVNGETYQAYNLGEYRTLLTMDNDLRTLTAVVAEDQHRIAALNTAVSELQLALHSAQDSITTLNTERTRLQNLWQQENLLRLRAEASHEFDWLPWALAGGFLV